VQYRVSGPGIAQCARSLCNLVKRNALVANTAQSVLVTSLKVDENSFKRRQEKDYCHEIKATIESR
jgi:hypothetical protein